MTGYLWLCERCEGEKMLAGFISAWAPPSKIPMPVVIEECPECNGRGYWEAA